MAKTMKTAPKTMKKRRAPASFKSYISKVLKQVHPNTRISKKGIAIMNNFVTCLLYTSPSPRDKRQSRMPSSA